MGRKNKNLLLILLFTCVISVAKSDITIYTGDVEGQLIVSKGATLDMGSGVKVFEKGRIDNFSRDFYVGSSLTFIKRTCCCSTYTGTIHNHNLITVKKKGRIDGQGIIYNHRGFTVDEPHTQRAPIVFDGSNNGLKFLTDSYGYDQLTADQMLEAAYSDLVNSSTEDNGIETFYIRGDAVIVTPHGGRIPGTEEQVMKAKKRVKTEVIEIGDLALPFTDGSTPIPEFKKYNTSAYDMRNASSVITVNAPRYYGASIFSTSGYVPDASGPYPIELVDSATGVFKTEQVDTSLVLTLRSDIADSTVPTGLSFTSWDAGNSGIQERYSGLGADYWTTSGTTGDPVTIFGGDCSWYNGVLNVEGGGVVFDNKGAMPGGHVYLGKVPDGYGSVEDFHAAIQSKNADALAQASNTLPVEFESQGGAKDEYNRPVVYMNGNSTMYFNLPEDSDGQKVFSWYGDIHSTPTDRVIFQEGTVHVKGDCSGFQGSIGVCEGATFDIRSSDEGSSSQYEGRMFGGTCVVVDKDGNIKEDGVIYADSDSGLRPLTIAAGTIYVNDSTTVERGISTRSVDHVMDNFTIDGSQNNATAVMAFKDVVLNNIEIKGPNAVACFTEGDVVYLNNLNLDKGTLNFAGQNLGEVYINGASMGSNITAWTNKIVDKIMVNSGSKLTTDSTTQPLDVDKWELTNNVNLYLDVDPQNRTSDYFQSVNGVNWGSIDNKFVMKGIRLLTDPVDREYKFKILDFQNQDGYREIVIGDGFQVIKKDAVVSSPDGIALDPGVVGYTVTQVNGTTSADIDGNKYYFYGSARAGNGMIMMTRDALGAIDNLEPQAMFVTNLKGAIMTLESVFDMFGALRRESTGKYTIWNKSTHSNEKYSTIGDSANVLSYGTILGLDGEQVSIASNRASFMPTIFAGIGHRKSSINDFKAHQNEYTGGFKLAWFDNNLSFELVGAYTRIKFATKNHPDLGLTATADMFSSHAKVGMNLVSWRRTSLRADTIATFALAKTGKIVSETNTDNKIGKIYKVEVAPGLSAITEIRSTAIGMLRAVVMARYHFPLGPKTKFNAGEEVLKDIDRVKKGYAEFSIGVTKLNQNETKFGVKVAKTIGSISGFKINIDLGAKF
ncbi:MAG: hypothetical protein LBT03_01205 [Holosporales bacterium]|jgi:hypothetical protein|nr:hypothetical protein [Holosporales bacterium]